VDDRNSLWPYLPFLLGGIPVTLLVAALAMSVAIPAAVVLALGRSSNNRVLRLSAGFVIELFRGSSSLVQLFWAFYVLPFFGINLPALAAGVMVLGLNSGSYLSEVVRAGLNAVPQGQREAALTLGFSAPYRFFRIILPQALPLMIPPLGNALVTMVKFTSIVSLVTIQDLTFRANLVGSTLGDSSAVYVLVITVYFSINFLLGQGTRRLERIVNRRAGRGDRIAQGGHESRVPAWALGGTQ
jgi:polar amino acid transport system permease protein